MIRMGRPAAPRSARRATAHQPLPPQMLVPRVAARVQPSKVGTPLPISALAHLGICYCYVDLEWTPQRRTKLNLLPWPPIAPTQPPDRFPAAIPGR